MSIMLLFLALALAGALASIRLARRAGAEAVRLRGLNQVFEARLADRTRDLRHALDRSEAVVGAHQAAALLTIAATAELRRAMEAVTGFAGLMRAHGAVEPLAPRQARAVDQILSAADTATPLLNHLQDLARLDSGQIPALPVALDARLALLHVCESLAPRAQAMGVTLQRPDAPSADSIAPQVRADPERLHALMTGVVTTALRQAGPGGQVRTRVQSVDTHARLCVSHLGAASTTEARAGVDVALLRRRASAMGGWIEVEHGGGAARIVLVLPLLLPVGEAPPITLPSGAAILCIEGHASGRALLRTMNAALGDVRLHVAADAAEGLAMARALRPDVVLLDADLPDLDGFAVKARLDADPLTRRLPVVGLGVGLDPTESRRAREAGFHAWLTRPVQPGELLTVLGAILGAAPGDSTDRAA
ncbi:MAG: response regulator [Brevundimonas sp.]|uniref:ATP-binding response regulator n=1 Tax=Brevundimonas sp. TaxID=1871086 RepID=UPI0011F64E45|nr:response regulator [Brevundimonas sp.]RZJ17004.1 MAG: response regulator [Brevundimonas sp.]